jgi:hypothetical protein
MTVDQISVSSRPEDRQAIADFSFREDTLEKL